MIFPQNLLQSFSAVFRFFDAASQDLITGLWQGYHLSVDQLRNRSQSIKSAESGLNTQVKSVVSLDFAMAWAQPIYLDPMQNKSGFKPMSVLDGLDLVCVEIDELTWRQAYGYMAAPAAARSAPAPVNRLPMQTSDIETEIWAKFFVGDGQSFSQLLALIYTVYTTTQGQNQEYAPRYYMVVAKPADYDTGSSLYLTTGLCFQVDETIQTLPYLRLRATDDGIVDDVDIKFMEGVDYRFCADTHVVEFMPSALDYIGDETTLFCQDAEVVNTDLFAIRGSRNGIGDWRALGNVNNDTAAAVISAAGQSRQNTGLDNHARNMATALRVPVSDKTYTVVGQFETVGYVVGQNNTVITQFNGLISGTVYVDGILYPISANVIDFDGSLQGKTAYRLLPGRYDVVKYYSSPGSSSTYQTLMVLDPWTGLGQAISGIVAVCSTSSQGSSLPEAALEIFNTSRSFIHFVASDTSNLLKTEALDLTVALRCYQFDPIGDDFPVYHDLAFPAEGGSTGDGTTVIGSMIMAWPRHKTLILVDDQGGVIRHYLDAPLYSRLNPGDVIAQGDILCENIIVEAQGQLPGLKNTSAFRFSDKTSSANSIFEIVQVNPIASFGRDYPDEVMEVN